MVAQTGYLPEQLATKKAFRMVAEAKRVGADECLDVGICSEVVEDGKAFEETLKLAEHYAEFAPGAIGKTKNLMRDGFDRSYLQNLDEEAEAQENFVGSPDNLEGVLAFVEKRNQILKANNYIIEKSSGSSP